MASDSFEKLPNFRDVAQSVNKFCQQEILRPGLLFRSGNPDDATTRDREVLIKSYHVKTIIDLRTTTEHINAAKKHSEAAAIAKPALVPVSDEAVADTIKIPGIRYADINLNGKGFERSLIWQLSYFSLLKVVGLMALGYRMEAISIIGREVLQPRGLIGLGIDTIEHSKPEIKQVFDVLSDRDSWPTMVHCTQGKDRTGLIILLVLLLCGISRDAIAHDYMRTEIDHGHILAERTKEVATIGLDETFARCPKDFAQKITEHIESRYGTLQDYLLNLGVDEEQMQQVKSTLSVDGNQA